MRPRLVFEPHLIVKERKLPESGEWSPHFHGWCLLQIKSGVCYWQQPSGALELVAGSSLVLTEGSDGCVRASRLGAAVVAYFCMEPEKLTGLLSLTEQRSLKHAATQRDLAIQALPGNHPISERFQQLSRMHGGTNLSLRLQLLQLFVDLFARKIEETPAVAPDCLNGRGRLRRLLNEMVESEFVELSLSDLEPRMHCSSRHLSRLFREEVGASFREKQTELRLARACEMLANSSVKMVEVSLASGYQSHSLFSSMFKRRFGVSPGKWRQQQIPKNDQKQKLPALLAA